MKDLKQSKDEIAHWWVPNAKNCHPDTSVVYAQKWDGTHFQKTDHLKDFKVVIYNLTNVQHYDIGVRLKVRAIFYSFFGEEGG